MIALTKIVILRVPHVVIYSNELHVLLRDLGIPVKQEEANKIMKQLDPEGVEVEFDRFYECERV